MKYKPEIRSLIKLMNKRFKVATEYLEEMATKKRRTMDATDEMDNLRYSYEQILEIIEALVNNDLDWARDRAQHLDSSVRDELSKGTCKTLEIE